MTLRSRLSSVTLRLLEDDIGEEECFFLKKKKLALRWTLFSVLSQTKNGSRDPGSVCSISLSLFSRKKTRQKVAEQVQILRRRAWWEGGVRGNNCSQSLTWLELSSFFSSFLIQRHTVHCMWGFADDSPDESCCYNEHLCRSLILKSDPLFSG